LLDPSIEDQLVAVVAKEPLPETTLKAGRELMIVASVTLLLTVYEITIPTGTFGDFPSTPRGRAVLTGGLAFMLLYLQVKFIVWAFVDLGRWLQAADVIRLNNWTVPLGQAYEHSNRVRNLLDEVLNQPHTEKVIERGRDLIRHTGGIIDQTQAAIDDVRSGYRTLTIVQICRLGVDLLMPCVLAGLALWHVRKALWPFLKVLF
jgi:hypothetical protein